MILSIDPVWVVILVGAVTWALLLLVTFTIAHAKRDVTINITLLEQKL